MQSRTIKREGAPYVLSREELTAQILHLQRVEAYRVNYTRAEGDKLAHSTAVYATALLTRLLALAEERKPREG